MALMPAKRSPQTSKLEKNEKRNSAQMKEQRRNSQAQINEEGMGKLSEKEFRVMIAKVIQTLEHRMEKMQESINTFSKDLEEIKNKQTEVNNMITEIKNTLEGINSRITEAEEWIHELEDKMVKIIGEEQNKGKTMKIIEGSPKDLWDNIKCTNM